MFQKQTAFLLLTLVISAGCELEQDPLFPPFESKVGVNTPCIPFSEFIPALNVHVEARVEEFAFENDSRPASTKYVELMALFEAAHLDLRDCKITTLSDSLTPEVDEDFQEARMLYGDLGNVVRIYDANNLPWDDALLVTLRRGFNGADLMEDTSWMPEALPENPCKEKHNKSLNTDTSCAGAG